MSVRSVALDSGRSLSLRTRSDAEAVIAVLEEERAIRLSPSRVEEEAKPSGMACRSQGQGLGGRHADERNGDGISLR